MPTQEIPREHWAEFFHGFSRAHQGWFATVEILGREIGAQTEARELPFEGIAADLKDPGEDSIEVMVGEKPDSHVAHTILGPTDIRLDQGKNGEHEALLIEAPGQAMTLVRFRSPVSPDLVADVIIE